jgi:hypothetical protein
MTRELATVSESGVARLLLNRIVHSVLVGFTIRRRENELYYSLYHLRQFCFGHNLALAELSRCQMNSINQHRKRTAYWTEVYQCMEVMTKTSVRTCQGYVG